MLTALRSKATSWVVKALLTVLMLSFAVWGVGDFLRQAGDKERAVAKVGGDEILTSQLRQRLSATISNVSRQSGVTIDTEQAKQFGFDKMALDQLIEDRVYSPVWGANGRANLAGYDSSSASRLFPHSRTHRASSIPGCSKSGFAKLEISGKRFRRGVPHQHDQELHHRQHQQRCRHAEVDGGEHLRIARRGAGGEDHPDRRREHHRTIHAR